MADLVTLIDNTGSLTYIGQAFSVPGLTQADKSWKILRINDAVSGTTFLYADGTPTFTRAWSNRATLAYTIPAS
jgi:hypothetical protein